MDGIKFLCFPGASPTIRILCTIFYISFFYINVRPQIFCLGNFVLFYGSLILAVKRESNVSFPFVLSEAEVGTVLTSVTANDVDTYPALKYSIIHGDSMFSMDKYSGKIVLNRPLDYETKKLYEVNISASDSEHVAKTTLTIKVTDVNDNGPVFDDISYNRILPGKNQIHILLIKY